MVLNIETVVRLINDTIELSQMYLQNTLNFSLFLLYVTKKNIYFITAPSLHMEHSTQVISHFKLLKSLCSGLQSLKRYPQLTIIM